MKDANNKKLENEISELALGRKKPKYILAFRAELLKRAETEGPSQIKTLGWNSLMVWALTAAVAIFVLSPIIWSPAPKAFLNREHPRFAKDQSAKGPEKEVHPVAKNQFHVSGTLTDPDHRAIVGVAVNAVYTPKDGKAQLAATTITDEKGNYHLSFSRNNVLITTSILGIPQSAEIDATKTTVRNFSLAGKQIFYVRGKVYDLDGRPLPKALILAAGDFGVFVSRAESNASGEYTLYADKNIKLLKALPDSNMGNPVFLQKMGDWKQNGNCDFNLSESGAFYLRGRVLDEQGRPVFGASIEASPEPTFQTQDPMSSHWIRMPALSDEEGFYSLRVKNPVVEILARKGGWKLSRQGLWNKTSEVDFNLSLEILDDIRIHLTDTQTAPQSTPLAIVYDEQGRRMHVEYLPADAHGNRRLTLRSNRKPGYATLAWGDTGFFISPETLKTGKALSWKEEPFFWLEGKAFDSDGQTISQAYVTLIQGQGYESKFILSTMTDEFGSFKVRVNTEIETIILQKQTNPKDPSSIQNISLQGLWQSNSQIRLKADWKLPK